MAELAQLPRPVMCRSARLHPDHGRRQLGKKRQHLAAPQLPAQHRPLGGINPMQLKNMLRRIHSNSDNLVHGRLPCLRLQQPHSGTLDAVGGRPHHHAAASLFDTAANGLRSNRQMWLWVPAFAGTTRHMCATSLPDLAARCVRGLQKSFRPIIRGRRECRALDAPTASHAKIKQAYEHSYHGHTGTTRHSPRNGFTAYFALSSVTTLFDTVACASSHRLNAKDWGVGTTRLHRT